MDLSILNGFSRITPQDMDAAQIKKNEKSSTGYSRYYDNNEPKREALNGFSRVTFTNQELQGLALQGLSLQGQTILQGYALGDAQDIEEWEYLVNIEHPSVLQGFQTFVLNGKRKEKKAKRQEKREAKKTGEGKSLRPKQQKRIQRKNANADKKIKNRAIRTAKKEEKLLKKQQDAAAKRLRKQTRAERSTKKRTLKEESKRLKYAMKGERGGKLAELFGDAVPAVISDVAELARGGGDFSEMTAGDFNLPTQLEDFISQAQSMDPEDILEEREELLDETEDVVVDDENAQNKKALKASNSGLIILGLGVAGAVLASKSKKKKRA